MTSAAGTPMDGAGSPGGESLRVFVAVVADGVLRVCLAAGDTVPRQSPLVLDEFTQVGLSEVTRPGSTTVGAFTITYETTAGAFAGLGVSTLGGLLIRVTGARLTPIDLFRYDTDGQPPRVEVVQTVDGERTVIRNLVPHGAGRAFTAELSFAPNKDEGLYGLGQDERGEYNRRGTRLPLYQHNMRTPMPCLVSDRGYGLLFDCSSLMVFDDTGDDARMTLDAVRAIDFYVIAGGAGRVVQGFRRLTGHAPLLPKWAFGYIQSKERYRTSAELIDVARRYRQLGVPLDCVVQDWKTWAGGRWGQKTVDRTRYPDLAALRSALHAMNVHSMVSVWPNMAVGCDDQRQFAEAGLLLGDYSTYDAFDGHARKLYWEQLKTQLYDGFDAWWCDSTEPFSAPDWRGSVLLSDEERFALVGGEHRRYLGALAANLYSLWHARGIFEHEIAEQCQGAAERRVMNLTRSGYAGIQRFAAVLWSGDVSATWGTLRAEVSKSISMGLSGVPWWTTDAGGFFAGGVACWRRWSGDSQAEPVWFWNGDYDAGVENPGYRELYTRWLQFACFLPMFRSHGTDTPREIWNFGAEGEPFYDAIATVIRLRYRLLPSIYTVAAEAALCDHVMIRALLFDFGTDVRARGVHDEFVVGKSLLVCPVLEPSYFDKEGERLGDERGHRRMCYLPAGTVWHDFWTGERFDGGQEIAAEAPLDRIPLFVRAGSVLPMQGPVSHALENRDRFDVVVYPGADGTGELYDDDGLTYAYQRGDYTLVQFGWCDDVRTLTIRAQKWARSRPLEFCVRLGGQSKKIVFDGTRCAVRF